MGLKIKYILIDAIVLDIFVLKKKIKEQTTDSIDFSWSKFCVTRNVGSYLLGNLAHILFSKWHFLWDLFKPYLKKIN